MSWSVCLIASLLSLLLVPLLLLRLQSGRWMKKRNARPFNLFNALFIGVAASALFMFYPVHYATVSSDFVGVLRALLLSVFNAMQIFALGCEFAVVRESVHLCPAALGTLYQAWAAALFVLAPIFSFGFILSLFKNLTAYVKYLLAFRREVCVFSELNEKSLVLARDIKQRSPKTAIVFTDVFEPQEESAFEMIEEAKNLRAICFKNDILVVKFKCHAKKRPISFFAIGINETENLNHSLKLIEAYKARPNTNLYVFSTKMDSQLLLSTVEKGQIRVRRINEAESLINRVLYERGEIIFESARAQADGTRRISAVVVGMGRHGSEMVKALAWFGQMDGYSLRINAFDKDPLAEEKFIALAPELMSPDYNGVAVEGEAQYHITIHPDRDAETATFAREIKAITDATYVLVALGNDDVNISTAVQLRMYFERMGIHPVIQAIVYNPQQKRALQGLKNFRGQSYDIDFIGDMESSYVSDVIIDSELEEDALQRHLKWGKEEEFWNYEYNYRSSTASAIHMRARIKCGILGADKRESELTEAERDAIEALEHRRWNAYMRAEGYVFSGSKDSSSRNDLAKMHHNLVDFNSLDARTRRIDSRVGTK